jgi:hypothetical protein
VANALKLSVAYTLQGLTSNYLLVFMTFGLAAAGAVRAREWVGRGRTRALWMVVLSGMVAVGLLAPFLIHYLEAHRTQGLTRSLDEVAKFSASWRDYLSATGNIHYRTWSASMWRIRGAALFPGVTALALAAIAVTTGIAWRHRPARMWLALGVVGFVLSFGAALPGYTFLYHAVPILQGIRASVRFGFLVLASVAALAAFGLLVLQTKLERSPRLRQAVTIAALGLVTLEAFRVPVGYTVPHVTPQTYQVLKDDPAAVLLELPMYEPGSFQLNAPYMLHATMHWRPLVNGYSGFLPASYIEHYQRLGSFPDAASIAYLRELGVTYVAVHARGFADPRGQATLEAIRQSPALQPAITGPGLTIYKVRAVVQ